MTQKLSWITHYRGPYSQPQSQEEKEAQLAFEDEMQRRKEAGYRQTDNSVIVKFMSSDCETVKRNSFNQTILWNCPYGSHNTISWTKLVKT